MVFSNSTSLDGVIQEIDRICGATDNTYSLKAKTARVGQAIDRFYYLALNEDGDWQLDDANQTTLPVATANLVSGQSDYAFDSSLLMVTKVLCKDASSGNWNELQLVDQTEPDSREIWTLPSGNSGAPYRYDIIANSIILDPIPNYNSTSGLKVVFKRNGTKPASTDTTNFTPGVPVLFHEYLCRQASLPFLIENNLPQTQAVSQQIQLDEEAIKDFISNRNKVKQTKVKTVWRNPR